ncbi:MAG: putative chaperone protein [Cognaticolwellia sp.]|jgi:hypothetical chaperone protein
MRACGLDFGTSNTTLSLWGPAGVQSLELEADFPPPQTLPTLLYFGNDRRQYYGTRAVHAYLEQEMDGRFLQAIKRHLPSKAFTQTFIHGRAMDLSDLIAGFLEGLKDRAEAAAGEPVNAVMMGRPAVFHTNPERDALAQSRLEIAASLAGFQEIAFQFEPIAAARAFEASLDKDILCLVGDLGGGTTDFTLMRLGPSRVGRLNRHEDVLGSSGVDVAGNDLDAALVEMVVWPRLGYGSHWSPLGRPVSLPTHLHISASSWHALSFARTDANLLELAGWIRSSDDKVGLKRLETLLLDNLGFQLFQSVERCKIELSKQDEGILSFRAPGFVLEEPVSRQSFEAKVNPLLRKMGKCLDTLLADCQVERDQIGAVFLTGGTSLVPCVRDIFESRFPGRLLERDAFTSVGFGLGVEAGERFGAS